MVFFRIGIIYKARNSVRDRKTENCNPRALGATASDVFFQFAFEATVLATVGVLLGLVVGWWASWFTARKVGLVFVFDSKMAILALTLAFCLNLLFASWPAIRAAKLDPIQALQHE
jgi:ABC-type antimicrobial peptide transport system permease subunit